MSHGPKVLLLDIETAPILGAVWSIWQQNVGLNQIKAEWSILSFCAKWLGEDEVIYHDQRDHRPIEDDRHLLKKLWHLLDKADFVIAQNGKKFDLPKINARMIMAKMKPYSPVKVIDTLLESRRVAKFTSHKLEWMADKLSTVKKRKHGKFPGYELWRECLLGNHEAWEEMRLYNIDDVRSMEEVYLVLRPWIIGHPNVGVYIDPEDPCCPRCGGKVQARGYQYTQVNKYRRYQCVSCKGWSRGRLTVNTVETRRNLLVN